MNYKKLIREVPNFPKPGILFYDITTLLKDRVAFRSVIGDLTVLYRNRNVAKVVGIESRGFILGAPLAHQLSAGFVPVRKSGKLPADIFEVKYNLEYGSNSLAVHRDAITMSERVLIVDDLLATGGTAAATVNLVRQLRGGNLGVALFGGVSPLQRGEKIAGREGPAPIPYLGAQATTPYPRGGGASHPPEEGPRGALDARGAC